MSAEFITDNQFNNNGHDLERPVGTLIAQQSKKPKYLVSAFLFHNYNRDNNSTSVEKPCTTLTTHPQQRLVTAEGYVASAQYNNIGRSFGEPMGTILASRKQHYVVQPVGGMSPPEILPTDSPATRKIKEFMHKYGIVDVKVRSLFIEEMLVIMGFPPDYKLIGTKTEWKKFIGNAVQTNLVTKMITHSWIENAA